VAGGGELAGATLRIRSYFRTLWRATIPDRSRLIWTRPNGFPAHAREAAGEPREDFMAKTKNGTGVYRIVDVVGVSKVSWEDAAKRAVETAAQSIRDLRIAEVTKMDVTVENGTISAFRTRVALSFKYEK
jgi:flavin-binding protein dodecin